MDSVAQIGERVLGAAIPPIGIHDQFTKVNNFDVFHRDNNLALARFVLTVQDCLKMQSTSLNVFIMYTDVGLNASQVKIRYHYSED